jgi:4-aminobutyrate aminotransferase-like enzyme
MTASTLTPISPAEVHGILARHLLGCGVRSIRFRPPLKLAPAEADAALEIVRKSLKEL